MYDSYPTAKALRRLVSHIKEMRIVTTFLLLLSVCSPSQSQTNEEVLQVQDKLPLAKVTWGFGLTPAKKISINGLVLQVVSLPKEESKKPFLSSPNPESPTVNKKAATLRFGAEKIPELPVLRFPPSVEQDNPNIGSIKSTEPLDFMSSMDKQKLVVYSGKLEGEKLGSEEIENMLLDIEAFEIDAGSPIFLYPVAFEKQTIAVVMTNGCPASGSTQKRAMGCFNPHVSVFMPTESGLSRLDLLESPLSISLEFFLKTPEKKSDQKPGNKVNSPVEIQKIKAIGANGAQTIYGDPTTEDRVHAKDTGFVSQRFDPFFLPLIGASTTNLFTNEAHRSLFAKEIGLENFRNLRAISANVTKSKVYGGRYLVFFGCMTDACMETYALIVLDGVTGMWRIATIEDREEGFFVATQSKNQTDEVDDFLFEQSMRSIARDLCLQYSIVEQLPPAPATSLPEENTDAQSDNEADEIGMAIKNALNQTAPKPIKTKQRTFKLIAKNSSEECFDPSFLSFSDDK